MKDDFHSRAADRILRYPYLVQRLRWTGKGAKAGSEGVKIGDFFDFDYMGSAEFEFGAIPAAKRVFHAELEALGWPEPEKIKVEEYVFWYVGGPRDRELAEAWVREELKTDFTGMKERSDLRRAVTEPDKWSPNGWWAIDGGARSARAAGMALFAVFREEQQARDFIKGVRG